MSYNLGPKEDNVQECELSRSDHLQNPQDLIARANFIYRGTEVLMFLLWSLLSSPSSLSLSLYHYYHAHYFLPRCIVCCLVLYYLAVSSAVVNLSYSIVSSF